MVIKKNYSKNNAPPEQFITTATETRLKKRREKRGPGLPGGFFLMIWLECCLFEDDVLRKGHP